MARADGLPLHDSLSRRLDVVLANGAESEPLLAADRALMIRFPDRVVHGLSLAVKATGAARAFMAVPGSDPEIREAVARACRDHAFVTVVPLDDVYPAGEPRVLLQQVLERQLPPNAQPESAGVMVADIHALWHLAEAARGYPVTHRFVTVAGEVKRPQTLRVPLGMQVGDLVELCGGETRAPVAYVAGGPLRGRRARPETPVTRATGAVLVLPEDHPAVSRTDTPLEVVLRRAASACAGCRTCTERCPQHLMGYRVEPHLLMRGLAHRLDAILEVVTGAGSCTGCRLCEAICPASLSPGRLYEAVAQDLQARGVTDLPVRPAGKPHESLEARRVSRRWLARRLGVEQYSGALPVEDNYLTVSRVTIPLGSGEPVVRLGQAVELGTLLAEPRGVGTRVHSPIAGRVSRIDDRRSEPRLIEIRSE